jgi:hypothetical protein
MGEKGRYKADRVTTLDQDLTVDKGYTGLTGFSG